jgi:hypothetical protein
MTKINPVLAGFAVAGAAVAAILALVPASQADTGWRVRQSPPSVVMTYFDQANGLVRFYVGGKEVAILNSNGVMPSHSESR